MTQRLRRTRCQKNNMTFLFFFYSFSLLKFVCIYIIHTFQNLFFYKPISWLLAHMYSHTYLKILTHIQGYIDKGKRKKWTWYIQMKNTSLIALYVLSSIQQQKTTCISIKQEMKIDAKNKEFCKCLPLPSKRLYSIF